MRKLIRYPPLGMNYVHQGKFMVLLSSDIDKVVAVLGCYPSILVRVELDLASFLNF